jgi:YegS/Rv2252/BmrU family lipid kinase
MSEPKKALLFFNPKSGHSKEEHHRELIQNHFVEHQINLETILVPKPYEELKAIVDQAISDGVDLFLVAGGDGTASMVSTHLVGKDIKLGVIPLGTGNLLAKALNVPQKIEDALDLITSSSHSMVKMDTFKMGDNFHLLNVSVGISPEVMGDVDSDEKQQLGFFAYFISFIQKILGLKLHRTYIDCDHQHSSVLASEILVTNIGTVGVDPLTWSEDISLNDGVMDLLIFRAVNIWDILGLVVSIFAKKGKFNPAIKFMKVREYCRIETQTPMRTQADGDVIGKTPFEIKIFPSSLKIIAGKNHHANSSKGVHHETL